MYPSAVFIVCRLPNDPVHFGRIDDTRTGNRPSFTDAAPPEVAKQLHETFCAALEREGVRVERGVFGARMQLALPNDGPVTIVLDAELRPRSS